MEDALLLSRSALGRRRRERKIKSKVYFNTFLFLSFALFLLYFFSRCRLSHYDHSVNASLILILFVLRIMPLSLWSFFLSFLPSPSGDDDVFAFNQDLNILH